MPALNEMSTQQLEKLAMDLAVGDYVEEKGKGLSDMSDEELLSLYNKTKESLSNTSYLDQFLYGWHKTDSDIQAGKKISEQYPIAMTAMGGGMGNFPLDLESAQKGEFGIKYNEASTNPVDFATKIREEQNKKKMEFLTEEYPNLVGKPDSLTTLGGSIAAYLASPTTAIPFGGTVPKAATVGAGLGFYDVAIRDFAEKGKVDLETAALAAAIGGGTAGITQGLINLFRKSLAKKTPVKSVDLDKFIKEGDNRILADQINERLGILSAEERKIKTAKSADDINSAFRELPEDKVLKEMKAENMNLAFAEKELKDLAAQQEKESQIKQMWIDHERQKTQSLQQIQNDLAKIPELEPTPTSIENAYNKAKEKINNGLESKPKQPTTTESAQKQAQSKIADHLSKDVSDGLKVIKKEIGSISPQIIQHIATSSVGGAIGYSLDPTPEGFITGAVLGGFTPWTIGKLYKAIRAGSPKTENSIADKFAQGVRPWVAVKHMGPSGELLSKFLDLTNLQIDLRIGEVMHKVEDRLYNLSKEERVNLIKVMQKAEQPLTNEIRQLSVDLRNVFEQNVREYAKAGIISSEKSSQLIKFGREKGYWPRIYNEAFLDTSQGQKAWEQFFESQHWSKKDLEETINKILHGDPERTKFYMKSVKKTGETYFVPRHIARNLLKERKNLRVSNKSSHIEESRKINVKEEQLLNQFMVDDPYAVLNDYLFDTFKRLEYAKTFGVKDERAHQLFERIEKELSSTGMSLTDVGKRTRFAQNVYWTSIGSSNSETIAAHMKLSDFSKTAYGKADAIATWLLSHAQIINMPQALANGTIQIAGTRNPFSAFGLALKGIVKSLGKEGKKFAQQTNAAGEATLMEIMGEYGAKHRVFQTKLPGAFEWLNDPTKFLQVTGFSYVEKLQRRFAVNMGKVYVEDLLSRKARLLERQVQGKWFSQRNLDNINKALKELYIDTKTVNMDLIPEKDLVRASLKFSNIVNFRSNPIETPMIFQSPHARLFKKFKTFVYQQGAFINSKMLKPTREYIYSGGKQGSLSPLLAFFGVVVPVLGVPVDKIRDLIIGDDRDLTGVEMYLNGMFAVGGLGIFADLAKSAFYGEGKITSALAGPTFSQGEKLIQGVINTGRKIYKEEKVNAESFKPLGKNLARMAVFPGRDALIKALKEKSGSKRKIRERRKRN